MIDIITIIIVLIIINGVFAMSEIAIVSSRKARLEELLRKGNKAAKTVMNLSETPNKFLSTFQVGITTISILLGVFSGTNISNKLAGFFYNAGIVHPYNSNLAVIITVIIITYLSIVIGELVPKRIGMSNPETISMLVIKPTLLLSKIVSPFVWLLSKSTDFIVSMLKIPKKEESQVTENEIKALIEEGTNTGEIQEIEQDIVERVFHLGDQQIGALMTSRNDIIWLNINESIETNKNKIASFTHSIYPVCENELDNILGIIYVKDLFNAMLIDPSTELKQFIKPVNILPDSQKAYHILEKFKETKIHFAIVVDEFGTAQGVVTINDIMDALVGDITETDEPEIIRRSEVSWLIDGKLAFFEFLHEFDIEAYNYSKDNFNSIGGFVIHQLKTIPAKGDKFQWNDFIFEITDMDGNRVDKILLTKILNSKEEE
jgi:putative hemolysin